LDLAVTYTVNLFGYLVYTNDILSMYMTCSQRSVILSLFLRKSKPLLFIITSAKVG